MRTTLFLLVTLLATSPLVEAKKPAAVQKLPPSIQGVVQAK